MKARIKINPAKCDGYDYKIPKSGQPTWKDGFLYVRDWKEALLVAFDLCSM